MDAVFGMHTFVFRTDLLVDCSDNVIGSDEMVRFYFSGNGNRL